MRKDQTRWEYGMNIYDKSYISKMAAENGFNRDIYEKVLRLVDILEFINHDEFLKERLALKGGTAINLLQFDLPRLSVDIDLDYTINTDVGEMKIEREEISRRIMKFMNQQGYTRKKSDRQSFILDSYYFTYTNAGSNSDHIKFDINYVMRAHLYPIEKKPIITKAFEIEGGVNALSSIEIYGSKINALNNRAAVRDLYDVWKMIQNNIFANRLNELKKSVIFYHILTSDEVDGQFDFAVAKELKQNSILRELVPVLKKGDFFILEDALETVAEFVADLMKVTDDEEAFISNFCNGDYRPELLFDDSSIIERVSDHPMARFKASKNKQA